jgi:hypothetical protein
MSQWACYVQTRHVHCSHEEEICMCVCIHVFIRKHTYIQHRRGAGANYEECFLLCVCTVHV